MNILTLLLITIAVALQGNPSKIQPYLQERMTDKVVSIPILVYMSETADLNTIELTATKEERHQKVYDLLRETAIRSQKNLRTALDLKGVSYKAFYITNVIAIDSGDRDLIYELSQRSDVRKVSYNPNVKHVDLQPTMAKLLESLNGIFSSLIYVKADQVWKDFGVRGEGIVVAGQDTGVQWDHPALKAQYRGTGEVIDHNYNWHDAIHKNSHGNSCGEKLSVPCDDNAHGTHTIGSAVGSDGDANQVGVAPEAKWIACRNMDAGYGTPATYIECFEFFLAPYAYGANAMTDGDISKAPHVINNSWGCPASEGCEGDEFVDVLKALEVAGIMVVVSAGNAGPGCGSIADGPAHNSVNTLTVGAMNHITGRIATFSSRGPSAYDGAIGPGVAAPGVNIRSAVPGSSYAQFGWSGTSMAGPHVAGQVALMWSANPKLIGEVAKTRDLIYKTATARPATVSCGESLDAIPNNTFGYGVIDVYAAVKAAVNL